VSVFKRTVVEVVEVIGQSLRHLRPDQTEGVGVTLTEYCVVQTFKDLGEPYQVSFYIRDTNGVWRWNYLEHEDIAWRSASVKFSNDKAIVYRNGIDFKEIAMPTGTIDLASVPGGYVDYYCPSEFAAQDVLNNHNNKYR
jgi:hypothetical protein